MNCKSRLFASLLILPLLAGCAGGWRGGSPPAEWATDASPAGSPTTTTAAAKPAGTYTTADAAVFVWKAEGNAVNVAGEFNSWSTSADPLKKQADGSWKLEKKLAPGKYAYKFVIDGGNWKPDPSVSDGVDDGFGGKNSIVVVGGAGAGTAAPAAAAAATGAAVAAGAGPAVTAAGVVFKYAGPANTVNLAGEFNSWSTSADPLTKGADGTFSLTKALAPGKYAYKFVVDGSNWKEDPAAAEFVDDGYGGKNSIVVVGGAGAGTAAPAAAAAATGAAVAAGAGPAVTAAGVVFKYAGPANTVNLAGEFNSWSTSADPLTKGADGTFSLTKALAPGKYAYKFVVDGSNWREDPAAAEFVDDGYGGKNSIVVVGAPAGTGTAPAVATATVGAAAAVTIKPLAPGAGPRPPRQTPNGVVFVYAGPAKSGVTLCGDFNGWSATGDRMSQAEDGTWRLTRQLAPGTYGYKYLVDGTAWKTDAGNPETQDDGLGGKNSVVVVK